MVGGAVTTTLWTFGASSSLRCGGAFSNAVGRKKMGVLELLLLVSSGWRRAGGSGEPFRVSGRMVAGLALLLVDGDRSCRI